MKNKNYLLYAIGSSVVVIGLGVAALNQSGGLLQGRLTGNVGDAGSAALHMAASESSTSQPDQRLNQTVSLLLPTSQIRLGNMPFLKMAFQAKPDYFLTKIKASLDLHNLAAQDLHVLRNNEDITALVDQSSLRAAVFAAKGKSLKKVLEINFLRPMGPQNDEDIYELRFTTSFVAQDSTLQSSVVDLWAKKENEDVILRGPNEMTSLEVTYLPAQR